MAPKMTRKELENFIWNMRPANVRRGNGCHTNDSSEAARRACKIGTNSGVHGWNWDAWYDWDTDTLWVDGYRNY